jgi:hypothetical protein
LLALVAAEPPIDIGRDQAADEARRELSKGIYNHADDGLITRALNRFFDWVGNLLDDMAASGPGPSWGLVILIGVIALLVVVVLWRAGVLRTTQAARMAVFGTDQVRTAKQYRAEAETAAGSGRYAVAVRARFRACAAELAERTILDDRAGRTAREVAEDAARAIPDLGGPLRPAAQVFNEVVYGNRPAGPQQYAIVTAADDAARTVSTRSLVTR